MRQNRLKVLARAFSALGASINAVLGALTPFGSFAAVIQAAADAVGKFAALLNRVTAARTEKTPPETPPRVAGTEDARARFRRAQYGLEEPAAVAPATRPAPEVTTPETLAAPPVAPPAPRKVLIGAPGSQREFQVPTEGGAPLTPSGAATIFRGGIPTTYAVPREGQTLPPEQGGPQPGTVTVGPPGAPRQFTVPHETEPVGGRPGGELIPGLSLLPLLSGLLGGGAAPASPAGGAGLDQIGANAPEAAAEPSSRLPLSMPQVGSRPSVLWPAWQFGDLLRP